MTDHDGWRPGERPYADAVTYFTDGLLDGAQNPERAWGIVEGLKLGIRLGIGIRTWSPTEGAHFYTDLSEEQAERSARPIETVRLQEARLLLALTGLAADIRRTYNAAEDRVRDPGHGAEEG